MTEPAPEYSTPNRSFSDEGDLEALKANWAPESPDSTIATAAATAAHVPATSTLATSAGSNHTPHAPIGGNGSAFSVPVDLTLEAVRQATIGRKLLLRVVADGTLLKLLDGILVRRILNQSHSIGHRVHTVSVIRVGVSGRLEVDGHPVEFYPKQQEVMRAQRHARRQQLAASSMNGSTTVRHSVSCERTSVDTSLDFDARSTYVASFPQLLGVASADVAPDEELLLSPDCQGRSLDGDGADDGEPAPVPIWTISDNPVTDEEFIAYIRRCATQHAPDFLMCGMTTAQQQQRAIAELCKATFRSQGRLQAIVHFEPSLLQVNAPPPGSFADPVGSPPAAAPAAAASQSFMSSIGHHGDLHSTDTTPAGTPLPVARASSTGATVGVRDLLVQRKRAAGGRSGSTASSAAGSSTVAAGGALNSPSRHAQAVLMAQSVSFNLPAPAHFSPHAPTPGAPAVPLPRILPSQIVQGALTSPKRITSPHGGIVVMGQAPHHPSGTQGAAYPPPTQGAASPNYPLDYSTVSTGPPAALLDIATASMSHHLDSMGELSCHGDGEVEVLRAISNDSQSHHSGGPQCSGGHSCGADITPPCAVLQQTSACGGPSFGSSRRPSESQHGYFINPATLYTSFVRETSCQEFDNVSLTSEAPPQH